MLSMALPSSSSSPLQARNVDTSNGCNPNRTLFHNTLPEPYCANSSSRSGASSLSSGLTERGSSSVPLATTTSKADMDEQASGADTLSSAPHCGEPSVGHTTTLPKNTATDKTINQDSGLNGSTEEAPTAGQLAAATKIQAAIRGYNTRRDLFAGPILTALQKWKYLCLYSRLNTRMAPTSTTDALQDDAIDQLDKMNGSRNSQERNARLWTRMMLLTSQIGKGYNAAPSEEALVLLTEHWLEMSDKKHRYGSNLKPYHECWLRGTTNEDFFDWLDNGSGKDLSLKERPRSRLESELVQYLQEHEREQYAVTAKDGLLYYRESGELVHTLPASVRPEDEVDVSQILPDADANDDEETRLEKKRLRNRAKYIYVMDPKGVLYIARKIKGKFHHSSFFGGGTVCAAGGLVVNHGRLIKVNPKSGHYRPGQTHFDRLLRVLREMGIPMENVKISTSIFEQAEPAVDG